MAIESIGQVIASSKLGDIRLVISMETDPNNAREVYFGVDGATRISVEGMIQIDNNLAISFTPGLVHLSPLGLCVAKCVATSILGPVLDCIGAPDYILCLKSKGISVAGHVAICIADCISTHAP